MASVISRALAILSSSPYAASTASTSCIALAMVTAEVASLSAVEALIAVALTVA